MALISFVLGRLILFFNWLFTPRSVVRAPEAQAAIDAQTASLVLYQYEACPFWVKVPSQQKSCPVGITKYF